MLNLSHNRKNSLVRFTISLSKHQRQQLDELVKRKIFTTINQAIRSGINLLIRQEKLERWDDQLFVEYESGVLKRHHRTGVLLSVRFQKDLNFLVRKKEPQLRRGVWVVLRKIIQKNPSLKIKTLELKNYYSVEFEFKNKSWWILFRRHQQDVIVCRINSTIDQA